MTGPKYPLSLKDVVAVGLADKRCVVGVVDRVTEFGPRLALCNFWDGLFGPECTSVRWTDIVEIHHAAPYDEDDEEVALARALYKSKGPVYNTDPLGEFQVFWTKGQAALDEFREQKREMENLNRDRPWKLNRVEPDGESDT